MKPTPAGSKTSAHNHADLVDRVLAVPMVAKKLAEGAIFRVCPTCEAMYEDFCTPDSVPYCARCYGRLNRFALGMGMAVNSVPIQSAPDSALERILKDLEKKKSQNDGYWNSQNDGKVKS